MDQLTPFCAPFSSRASLSPTVAWQRSPLGFFLSFVLSFFQRMSICYTYRATKAAPILYELVHAEFPNKAMVKSAFQRSSQTPFSALSRQSCMYSPTWVENICACVAQPKERKAETLAIHDITSPKKEVPKVS